MFILNKSGKTIVPVKQMYEYMTKAGLRFVHDGFGDNSPYAILGSGTSIGYRVRSKWGKKGIVFFCSEDGIDKDGLVENLHLDVEDNSADPERPYAIFIPETEFENAVAILMKNSRNR